MNAFAILGAALAALMYVPSTIGVWKKELTLNFATFFLWALLDAIAAGSILAKGGNFLLPAIYVLCCSGVLIGILRTKTFTWGWVESVTSVLVIICIVIWALVGSREATIASSLAVAIAGGPQLLENWKKPREAPIRIYFGFTVANAVSLLAGKDWSIAERFYPTTCTALTLLFVLVAARRWLPAFRQQSA